jgi:hypothetical protein
VRINVSASGGGAIVLTLLAIAMATLIVFGLFVWLQERGEA